MAEHQWTEEQLQYQAHQREWCRNSKIKAGDKVTMMQSFTTSQGGFSDELTDAVAACVGKTGTVIDPFYTASGKRCYLGVVCNFPTDDGKGLDCVMPFFCLVKTDD